jgi:transposase InsO family protein
VARSTIYAVLRRFGLSRLRARSTEPVVRYEWPNPGDLVHLDVKKLGRIPAGGGHRVSGRSAAKRHSRQGWEFVHVAIDDHSRLAYAEVLGDERAETTVGFAERALGFFEAAGIVTHRILTDNGNNYRSHQFLDALASRGIRAIKTRPYRPQTNGKAEAFVKIVTNEWAYGQPYRDNEERAEMLGPFQVELTLSYAEVGLPSVVDDRMHDPGPSHPLPRSSLAHRSRRPHVVGGSSGQ